MYDHMSRHGQRLGGEQSGHIIFSKYATTGDGILTSLKVMEVMLTKKQPLSKLAEPVSIYPQHMVNVRVLDKTAALADIKVKESIAAVEQLLGDSGRILVRPSGTEPVIRVMVEAETQTVCRDCVERVVQTIAERGYAVSRQ